MDMIKLEYHIPAADTLHNHRCENLKSYMIKLVQHRVKLLYTVDTYECSGSINLLSSE
jgi:hypothetical protein